MNLEAVRGRRGFTALAFQLFDLMGLYVNHAGARGVSYTEEPNQIYCSLAGQKKSVSGC